MILHCDMDDLPAGQELGDFGFLRRVVAHLADVVAHAAVALADDRSAICHNSFS